MFANSFDPVIPEVKTGADEELPGPIKGTYYLNFRTVGAVNVRPLKRTPGAGVARDGRNLASGSARKTSAFSV